MSVAGSTHPSDLHCNRDCRFGLNDGDRLGFACPRWAISGGVRLCTRLGGCGRRFGGRGGGLCRGRRPFGGGRRFGRFGGTCGRLGRFCWLRGPRGGFGRRGCSRRVMGSRRRGCMSGRSGRGSARA